MYHHTEDQQKANLVFDTETQAYICMKCMNEINESLVQFEPEPEEDTTDE
jgi:transcription initiation factor TFIIIB Brf1 subunit/transcription initiation factor TFIIB